MLCGYIDTVYYRQISEITVGSVPEHHSKANSAVKRVTQSFWFPSASQSYVYAGL